MPAHTPPTQAAFVQRSYAPGDAAVLRLRGGGSVRISIFHAGAGHDGVLQGALVSAPQRSTVVHIGNWASGLYYARVDSSGGTWDAPFVLRPRVLGTHRILVVLPTNTWQAYNFEDDDSWYESAGVHTIELNRPFIDNGVPPHYRGYDRGFIRWLHLYRVQTDFVSDDDIDRFSGDTLARSYSEVVFSGHEEYVTQHEYDAIQRYRDLGGSLAFLSANDFFYKVVKHGDQMDGRWRWRDLGRPEAALVGEQYVDWNHDRYPNQAYHVTNGSSWVFAGTGLTTGATFGVYGIEIDAVCPASPRGTQVLARIPNAFGPGKSAEMTYYESERGAEVFSAGVMNFGGSALWPQVRTMVGNVIARLARRDVPRPRGTAAAHPRRPASTSRPATSG
jgi:hypothetical protein